MLIADAASPEIPRLIAQSIKASPFPLRFWTEREGKDKVLDESLSERGGGREKAMKKHIIPILFILGLVIGFSVLLYPYVGDYLNSQRQTRVVARYYDDVANMEDGRTQELLGAAREYNRSLLRRSNRFNFTEAETERYKALLNNGRNVMGVLSIDKIDVSLPIYHGSDEGVLQVGLGHLQGTSLPVGGIGTHSFITGHRGLPSSTLLSDLNKMAEGDTFVLHVMGETLTYLVDDIQTVEPQEVNALSIDPSMDYCTLVTCTPYGINTHRLLVRGRRVENAVNIGWRDIYSEARRLDKVRMILIFMVPVMLALIILLIAKGRKINRGGIIL